MKQTRTKNLIRSEIRNMSEECDKINGINLSQGICDLPLPENMAQYAKIAMDEGHNHYTSHEGIIQLREAVSNKLKIYNNITKDPNTEIVITSGSTGGFYSACLALLNPGDECIVFEPFYGYHIYTLQALDLVPIYVSLKTPDFSFDINEIESKITKNTKAILVNTPSNPSGKVFSKDELEILADLCLKYDLYIFTDEIYEYIVYDGKKHVSPMTIDKIKHKVITIGGYSKTFSITGWRIGYVACDEHLAKKIAYASDLVYVCPPSPLQYAVAKTIDTLDSIFYKNLKDCFFKRRNMVCDALKSAGLTPFVPEGAYYTLLDISSINGDTSKDKVMYILNKTGVALVPGSAFYNSSNGDNLARLCFAKDDSVLEDACNRLLNLKK